MKSLAQSINNTDHFLKRVNIGLNSVMSNIFSDIIVPK